MHRNVHGIDEWLIRAGYLTLAVALLAFGCAEGGTGAAAVQLWQYVALAGAGVMLVVGYVVRRDARRIERVWRILDHATEAHIDELQAATGQSREFLLRAVRTINGQPGVYYVWDESSGTVVDGRMRSQVLLVERCEGCGAAVGARLSLDLATIPNCAHCGAPITSGDLNRLKHEQVQALRREALRPRHAFSLWLFVLLIVVFWPAGVVYAVWTSGLIDQLLGRARA